MELNEDLQLAADFIRYTDEPLFLTGKAGTGKTTFLRYIRTYCGKQSATVAPTGVAAMNAGGNTIHSFFQIPFGPFLPTSQVLRFGDTHNDANDRSSFLSKLKLNAARRDVMEQLQLLIIDEVSMVRCDTIDAIDLVLRHVRRNDRPFGGVQVLFIGDLHQLPPVVRNEELQLLQQYYNGPYFFNSKACEAHPPVLIELTKVYRQSDNTFINVLNEVRHNELSTESYNLLNERLGAVLDTGENSTPILLTTHNEIATQINMEKLADIPKPLKSFEATVSGDFNPANCIADEHLQLKAGAQVMFIKNDTSPAKRYFNGKIGRVESFEDEEIIVHCEDGEEITVAREKWQNFQYTVDKNNGDVNEEVLGTLEQFPLKLAWAITIHKSQGLTFDHVVIDAVKSFAAGQVYVALSRCRSLQGISLRTPITPKVIRTDMRLVQYYDAAPRANPEKLLQVREEFEKRELLKKFDFTGMIRSWQRINVLENRSFKQHLDFSANIISRLETFKSHGRKFMPFIEDQWASGKMLAGQTSITDRLSAAGEWFLKEIENLIQLIDRCPLSTDNRAEAAAFTEKLKEEFHALQLLRRFFQKLKNKDLETLFPESNFVSEKLKYNAYAGKSQYVPADIPYAGLYIALKDERDLICDELELPVYMVANTESLILMTKALPQTKADLAAIKGFGKAKVAKFGARFLDIIQEYCMEHDLDTPAPVAATARQKKSVKPAAPKKEAKAKTDTKAVTYDAFKAGNSIEQIALNRGLHQSTIEGHLCKYIASGELDVEKLVDKNVIRTIENLLTENMEASLSELKQGLPKDISFGQIRMVKAALGRVV